MTAGIVRDLGTLEVFLRGRLASAGLVAAGIAAVACAQARGERGGAAEGWPVAGVRGEAARGAGARGGAQRAGAEGAGVQGAGVQGAGVQGAGVQGAGVQGEAVGGMVAGGVVAGGESESARREFWVLLDAEVDARTPSPAQREASRRQGRALLRAARIAWPEAAWLADLAPSARGRATAAGPGGAGAPGAALTGQSGAAEAQDRGATRIRQSGAVPTEGRGTARIEQNGTTWGGQNGTVRGGESGARRLEYRGGAHHAVVLGAAAAAGGCEPGEAARIAAYQAVAGPVSAAVRLLALDPMKATGVLARLASEVDQVAGLGATYAGEPLDALPCASAPALDLLAEAHMTTEVRLFES